LTLSDDNYVWLTLPNEGVDPLSVTDFYRNAGKPKPGDVFLSLPKFDIGTTTDLQNPLKELGITDVFSSNADFSAITSHTTLPLQDAEHSVRVSMDEDGVFGSAYTIISPPGSSSPSENLIATLIFDRPFTFTIVSSEGLPLFTGIVNNPTA
jgi:serpin B